MCVSHSHPRGILYYTTLGTYFNRLPFTSCSASTIQPKQYSICFLRCIKSKLLYPDIPFNFPPLRQQLKLSSRKKRKKKLKLVQYNFLLMIFYRIRIADHCTLDKNIICTLINERSGHIKTFVDELRLNLCFLFPSFVEPHSFCTFHYQRERDRERERRH